MELKVWALLEKRGKNMSENNQIQNKQKLLPCPFCNKQPNLFHCDEYCCGALPRWFDCECELMFDVTGVNTDEEAIEKWNNRLYN